MAGNTSTVGKRTIGSHHGKICHIMAFLGGLRTLSFLKNQSIQGFDTLRKINLV
jgi:hypothetical protein